MPDRTVVRLSDDPVQQLFRYFRISGSSLPRGVTGLERYVNFLNENSDLVLSPVTLEPGWFRTATGPILAETKKGVVCALIPDGLGRYHFIDDGTRKRVRVQENNQDEFLADAWLVTQAIPADIGHFRNLLGCLLAGVSRKDRRAVNWLCFVVPILLYLVGRVGKYLISDVVLATDIPRFLYTLLWIFFIVMMTALFLFAGSMHHLRMVQKAALSVLPGISERPWFSRRTDATPLDMAELRDHLETVADWYFRLRITIRATIALWVLSIAASVPVEYILLVLILIMGAITAVLFWRGIKQEPDRRGSLMQDWIASRPIERQFAIQRPIPDYSGKDTACLWESFTAPISIFLLFPLLGMTILTQKDTSQFFHSLMVYLPLIVLNVNLCLRTPRAAKSAAVIRTMLPAEGYRTHGEWVPLPDMPPILELKDVSFSYPNRKRPVLRDISLRLNPGETVGILGNTGSGKRTLARLMAGDLTATSGNVYYKGVDLDRFDREAVLRWIGVESGSDISLYHNCPKKPEKGRTCVVFSTRESDLQYCNRILKLTDGRLTELQPSQRSKQV